LYPMKVRNDEWVGARPSMGSTVLLWTQDIACPKGIATEKRFLYKRGESWTGLWSGGSSSTLKGGEVVVCNVAKGM
jgi:hypothetical protein